VDLDVWLVKPVGRAGELTCFIFYFYLFPAICSVPFMPSIVILRSRSLAVPWPPSLQGSPQCTKDVEIVVMFDEPVPSVTMMIRAAVG
jgi:hypothetical protein